MPKLKSGDTCAAVLLKRKRYGEALAWPEIKELISVIDDSEYITVVIDIDSDTRAMGFVSSRFEDDILGGDTKGLEEYIASLAKGRDGDDEATVYGEYEGMRIVIDT